MARLKTSVEINAAESRTELLSLRQVVETNDDARREEIRDIREKLRSVSQSEVMNTISKEMDKFKAVASAAAGNGLAARAMPTTRREEYASEREKKYWIARRGMRCWPVPGTQGEIRRNAALFLKEKLEVEINLDEDVEFTRRVLTQGRRGQVNKEIIIRFNTVETRDAVAANARKLGRFVDAEGKPTAGIRMEIPEHLSGTYRELEDYGRDLKGIHGRGLKWQVRFDDKTLGFYLDVRMPGDEERLVVDIDMAREGRMATKEKRRAFVSERLTSSTSSQGETVQAMDTEREITTNAGMPTSEVLTRFGKPTRVWNNKT